MGFFRDFSAVPFDHIFERNMKFSAAKSKSGVASFRTKISVFLVVLCSGDCKSLIRLG